MFMMGKRGDVVMMWRIIPPDPHLFACILPMIGIFSRSIYKKIIFDM